MTAPDLSRSTNDGRFYNHPYDGREAPSITNIINVMDKPGIAGWGYRKCGEFVADNMDAIVALKGDRAALVDLVRLAPYRKSDDSSYVGDVVHSWAERHIKKEDIPAEEFEKPFVLKNDQRIFLAPAGARNCRHMWRQFLGAEAEYNPKWLHSEVTVWSDEYDYAGTLDLMCGIRSTTVLVDIKTGNRIYDSAGLQLAAIHFADYAFDEVGNKFDLPKATNFAVLHLRPRYARLTPVLHIEESFKAFLGLRDAFEWKVKTAEHVLQFSPKIETPVTADGRVTK